MTTEKIVLYLLKPKIDSCFETSDRWVTRNGYPCYTFNMIDVAIEIDINTK